MGGLSFITKGFLCLETNGETTINKYVLPYNLEICAKENIELDIRDKKDITLNLDNIIDKQVNLKISEDQINIKNNTDSQINIEE